MKDFFKQPLTIEQTPLCEGLSQSFLQRVLRSLLGFFSVHAYQDARAFLRASIRATSNNRTYAGLILMGVVTPVVGVCFRYFDHTANIPGFGYYTNWFWLFYVTGPHIMMLLTLTGVFLILEDSTRAYFMSVPAAYSIAKILWLIQVTTDAEIRQDMPFIFLAVGVLTGVIWLFMANYLTTLHYHKRAGHLARAKGILQAADIDNEQRVRVALENLNAYEKLN